MYRFTILNREIENIYFVIFDVPNGIKRNSEYDVVEKSIPFPLKKRIVCERKVFIRFVSVEETDRTGRA